MFDTSLILFSFFWDFISVFSLKASKIAWWTGAILVFFWLIHIWYIWKCAAYSLLLINETFLNQWESSKELSFHTIISIFLFLTTMDLFIIEFPILIISFTISIPCIREQITSATLLPNVVLCCFAWRDFCDIFGLPIFL